VAERHRFKFPILGRYPARMKGNQTAVAVNMVAGEEGHPVHCGTLTLSDAEFGTLVGALRKGLMGAPVEIEDHGGAHPLA
jgi:hypothetical protein